MRVAQAHASLPGIACGQHQGVRDHLHVAGPDEGRFQLHLPQAAVLVGGEAALLVPDPGELRGRPGVARTRLPAHVLPSGDQLGRPLVAAAGDPVEPFGERPLDARPVLVHQAVESTAAGR